MRNMVRNHQQTKQDITFSMACSNQPSIPSVPASTPYSGKYGFEIAFQKQKKETKSATWTYSQELKKLYVRMRSSCPIRFRTCTTPPQGCLIRALPLYMKPEHIQEVVRRCPNHSSKVEDLTGEHFLASDHLLLCENKESQYVEDIYTGRLSVVIPHEIPQAGTEWVTNLFQFACFSSCVGGLNRRPLQVVFTLEHGTEVLGRQSVEVRICACPGRDRRTEEKTELEDVRQSTTKSSSSVGNKRSRDVDQSDSGSNPGLEMKRRSDHDDVYTIKVCGRQNYEMLRKLRDALELSDLIQPEQKNLILQQLIGDEHQVTMPVEEPSNFLLEPQHESQYTAYVISGMDKLAPMDQPHTENEVSSTGINLQLIDIQHVLPGQATSLSSLTPSAFSNLHPTPSIGNGDEDEEDGCGDDNDVGGGDGYDGDTMISSWLKSLNMSEYENIFELYHLYRLHDLEHLTSEDLRKMFIPLHNKDALWKTLLQLKSKKMNRQQQTTTATTTQRGMLAPISEFQHRPPPPLPPLHPLTNITTNNADIVAGNNNSNTIVSFADKKHQQRLIQLQHVIVNTHHVHNNNNPSKIELLTPIYYNDDNIDDDDDDDDDVMNNTEDHNYCNDN